MQSQPVDTSDSGVRPRIGRPPKDRPVDKEAEKLREQHTLPVPPAKTLSFESMQSYFKLLTPEMWHRIACYLYRIRPRIIRQLREPECPNYIDVLGQPFDMDYMIERHGGGRYQMEVTNIDMPRREAETQNQRGHLFRCNFDVDEVRYPPKLDYAELDLNHRDNMSYIQMLKAKGILDSAGKPMAPNHNPPPTTTLDAGVIKEILGLVRSLTSDQQESLRVKLANGEQGGLTKSIGDILVKRMEQDDPGKQFTAMKEMASTVKEMVAANKPADSSGMYQSLITMMIENNKAAQQTAAEQRRTDLEYLKIITESSSKTQEKTSDFGQFQQVFSFAREILQLGQRNAGERSGWDIGLDIAKELVQPGLGVLNNYLISRNAPTGAAGVPGQPAAGAFDPYANPQATAAYAASLRQAPSPSPGTTGAAPGTFAPAGPTDLPQLMQQYGILIVNALNQGTPGYDIADSMCVLLGGTAAHAAIAGQGEEAILQTMLSIPNIALFGPERLKTFTHEFIYYEKYLKEASEAETAAV